MAGDWHGLEAAQVKIVASWDVPVSVVGGLCTCGWPLKAMRLKGYTFQKQSYVRIYDVSVRKVRAVHEMAPL